MLLNEEQVKSILPHRKPFLFIDSVEEVILPSGVKDKKDLSTRDLVGTKVVAHFEVKEDLEILKGHFPGNPILPGVVLIELMAQASAFVSMPLGGIDMEKMDVETLLVSVGSSRFRKPVVPGMKLLIHATMVKNRGTIAGYTSEVFCDGEKISEAEFMAKLEIKEKE